MSMEKRVIGRTTSYLVSRDILLALLVLGHILVYYNFFSRMNKIIIPALCIAFIAWILFFTRLLFLVFSSKKDKYLVSAFSDEYFAKIKVKAGFNGYTFMCAGCLIFILGGILLDVFSINIGIPSFIGCEIIFLLGITTDDISKIVLSRG